jgi:hypothetical protein
LRCFYLKPASDRQYHGWLGYLGKYVTNWMMIFTCVPSSPRVAMTDRIIDSRIEAQTGKRTDVRRTDKQKQTDGQTEVWKH